MTALLVLALVGQDFQPVFDWTSVASYSTYELAPVLKPESARAGFATSNFYIYGDPRDTVSYDTRTLDLFARIGIARNLEFGLKYTSPRAGVISLKYQFLHSPFDASAALGLGYMKGTRTVRPNNLTYYCVDLYPGILATKRVNRLVGFYGGVRGILSRYAEEDNSDLWMIIHYGGSAGLILGPERFHFLVEYSHYWARTNKQTAYIAAQSGIGVELRI